MIRTAGSIIEFDTVSSDPRVLGGNDEEIAAGIAGFRALGLDHYIARVEALNLASLERLAGVLEMVDRQS